MDGDTSSRRKQFDEVIGPQALEEIERCLLVIRGRGQCLQRSVAAGKMQEAELIAGLEEIDFQTGRINQILIDA